MELGIRYDPWLVAFSYGVAAFFSYVALHLAPRVPAASDDRLSQRMRGIFPAATVLGSGIWLMHYLGMRALEVDGMEIGYRLDITILSLVVAVTFTAIGFGTNSFMPSCNEGALLAGVPMGAGILAMHFLGMMSMTGPMEVRYDTGLVLVAAMVAVAASAGALWLALRAGRPSVAAALVMGMAICGMHYIGMEAARFSADAPMAHPHDPAAAFPGSTGL